MKKTNKMYIWLLPLMILPAACGQPQVSPAIEGDPINSIEEGEQAGQDEAVIPGETSAADCYGPEVHPIGQSVASQYEEVTYEQVMGWFCNGAEFDDILVALLTARQTGKPAENFLAMLAKGQTWDEIWQSVGLTDG